jgi:hypothetical protein
MDHRIRLLAWLAMMALALPQPTGAQTLVFQDGFEPDCYGVANDRPGCIVVPFNQPPLTPPLAIGATAALTSVDIYVLIDRSGSMSSEATSLRNNLAVAVQSLTCPPQGTGVPGQCFTDAWFGAGTLGYSGSGVNAYNNFVDIRRNPNLSGLPISEPAGCCSEVMYAAISSTITGSGAASLGCSLTGYVDRATCAGSPAASEGFSTYGYPCFRNNVLPAVILVTDESAAANFSCPAWSSVVLPQMVNRHARQITILGSGSTQAMRDEFGGYAIDTGAVDASNGNAPMVFDGADTNASNAFTAAMQALRRGTRIDVSATVVDEPGDTVDAASLVERIEALNVTSAGCSGGHTVVADTFIGVLPGAALCFRLIPKTNITVPATATTQLFPARLRIVGSGPAPLSDQRIVFVVPRQ